MKWWSVILLVLVVPGVARADDPVFTPLADVPLLAPAAQLAHTYWPDSPCAGREMVALVTDPVVEGEVVGGYALTDGTCRFVVSAGLSEPDRCTGAVHEMGHLAGLGHSDAPGSVMNPTIGFYLPCWQAVTVAVAARLRAAEKTSRVLTAAMVNDFLFVHFPRGDATEAFAKRVARRVFRVSLPVAVSDTNSVQVDGRVRLVHHRILFTRG